MACGKGTTSVVPIKSFVTAGVGEGGENARSLHSTLRLIEPIAMLRSG